MEAGQLQQQVPPAGSHLHLMDHLLQQHTHRATPSTSSSTSSSNKAVHSSSCSKRVTAAWVMAMYRRDRASSVRGKGHSSSSSSSSLCAALVSSSSRATSTHWVP